jgi:hypothetical protein
MGIWEYTVVEGGNPAQNKGGWTMNYNDIPFDYYCKVITHYPVGGEGKKEFIGGISPVKRFGKVDEEAIMVMDAEGFEDEIQLEEIKEVIIL